MSDIQQGTGVPPYFSGDVIFTDHFMRRLRERYGIRPKRKQIRAAARSMLLGLLGEMTARSHFLHALPDGKMCWRLDIGGRSTNSVIMVRGGRIELVTALPRGDSDFMGTT